VVNRHLPHTLEDVLATPTDLDEISDLNATVAWGGPVELQSGTVVTTAKLDSTEGWTLETGVSITRSHEALQRLLAEGAPFMLCLGYAGWGPGQLDAELEQGGWLWTDIDPNIIFEVPVDDRYDHALAALGLTASMVWMQPVQE
jgi:putative transcriptional regulator